MKRIDFLDGLRGVAIILVIGFHAFSRWTAILPYGNAYRDIVIFKYGYLGVNLFFLISGFVILMSLEKNKSFFLFIYKRWLRLFPGMLIATTFIYLTADFFYERPAGIPNIYSIIPGLTFIEPNWIEKITGKHIISLEGAFWSIWVEVKFYFIFGLSYFLLGNKKATIAIFLMYLLYRLGNTFNVNCFAFLSDIFSFKYFAWFASGSLAYLYFVSKNNKYLYQSVVVSLIEIYQYRQDSKLLLFCFFIMLVFFTPIYFEKTRFLFTNSVLLLFGFISYPLYLIHQNTMIALICKFSKIIDIPYVLLPVLSLIFLVFISYFFAKTLEPFVRKMITQIITYANNGFAKWRS
jgi:hypothetical protein